MGSARNENEISLGYVSSQSHTGWLIYITDYAYYAQNKFPDILLVPLTI